MKNTIGNQEKHVQEIKNIVDDNELEKFVKETQNMNPEAYFLVCLVDGLDIHYKIIGTYKQIVAMKSIIREKFF